MLYSIAAGTIILKDVLLWRNMGASRFEDRLENCVRNESNLKITVANELLV